MMQKSEKTAKQKQARPADSSVDGQACSNNQLLLIECFGQNRNDLRFTGNHAFKKRLVLRQRYIVRSLHGFGLFTERQRDGIVVQDVRHHEDKQVQVFVRNNRLNRILEFCLAGQYIIRIHRVDLGDFDFGTAHLEFLGIEEIN